jgi:hypothetical protein
VTGIVDSIPGCPKGLKLSTVLLAALGAVAALRAGDTVNRALT